jgi:hypothetical protein
MNDLDQTTLRQQLHEAVDALDPVGPPLGQIEARATRRRTHRLAGFGAVAIAGAAAVAAAVVIMTGPGGTESIGTAAAPSPQSLADFAAAHGGIHSRFGRLVTTPIESSTGFYGAFTVKSGVQVANWNGSSWRLDGTAVSKLGPGRFVMRLVPGPQLPDMKTPTVYLRTMGGDVSYFGSVLQYARGAWAPVHFTSCGHHMLCPAGASEPYAHPHGTGVVSVHNNCTPDCADGSHYRVRWEWAIRLQPGSAKATQFVFVPARVHKVS